MREREGREKGRKREREKGRERREREKGGERVHYRWTDMGRREGDMNIIITQQDLTTRMITVLTLR